MLFQLSYSPRILIGYPLGRLPRVSDRGREYHRPFGIKSLLEQAGEATIGERLAAGLAGRAVLERGVGERDLPDGVTAHRAGLTCLWS